MKLSRTHAQIARDIRANVGAHWELIAGKPAGAVLQDDYLEAESRSMAAQSHARYLAQHLQGVNPAEFLRAAGVRP